MFLKFVFDLNAGWLEAASFYTHGGIANAPFLIHEITCVVFDDITQQSVMVTSLNYKSYFVMYAALCKLITIEKLF